MKKGLNQLLLIIIDQSLKGINDFIVHYFWVIDIYIIYCVNKILICIYSLYNKLISFINYYSIKTIL